MLGRIRGGRSGMSRHFAGAWKMGEGWRKYFDGYTHALKTSRCVIGLDCG